MTGPDDRTAARRASRQRRRTAASTRRAPTASRRVHIRARPGPGPAPPDPPKPASGLMELVNGAVGAGTLIAALMFYAGIIHSSSYYAYFRLNVYSLGLALPQVTIWSLRLVTMDVLIALALLALVPRAQELLAVLRLPPAALARVRRAARAVVRLNPVIVAAGVVLMVLWPYVQPYGWAAPLLVAAGLVLGQSRTANPAAPPHGWWRKGLPVAVAGLCVVWVIALLAGQLGRQDARAAADRLVSRTAVVVLSTERLSIRGPGIIAEDLGRTVRYRYRYSGLRLLIERDRRYYVLPLGWQKRTDATYVIDDDDTVRIELLPGTQPPRQ
ncbi:hypothetical protein M4V62_16755 [Streptomyces durmitorensis]|uniref:Integral membrane protein n=1 Tax=Streptomyces durmitorensis TaxID=319947 RepID=A0ABY4PTT4_9ACTN|nr:hypothetical protein [Streptomyces durmitorensis]UQT56614.1 hypothetical protein M4V62_16755 [Streptomyces durmitorensis]